MKAPANRIGDWMQTASGRAYWPLDPRASEVCIEDIAHSLSMQCRYAGHCQRFYSVAEHSILVSQLVPPEHALHGLLHDAAEAYLVDLPRPVKRHMPEYAEVEESNWLIIAKHFGIEPEMPATIKDADNAVLLAEQKVLMLPPPMPWSVPGEPADVVIHCLSPEQAGIAFMIRFNELRWRS